MSKLAPAALESAICKHATLIARGLIVIHQVKVQAALSIKQGRVEEGETINNKIAPMLYDVIKRNLEVDSLHGITASIQDLLKFFPEEIGSGNG